MIFSHLRGDDVKRRRELRLRGIANLRCVPPTGTGRVGKLARLQKAIPVKSWAARAAKSRQGA